MSVLTGLGKDDCITCLAVQLSDQLLVGIVVVEPLWRYEVGLVAAGHLHSAVREQG